MALIEGSAISEKTSRGVVWSWSHPQEEYYGLKSVFQVRDIPKKGIVVILGQDGLRGMDKYQVVEGGKLLDRRLNECRLMDYIVDSPEFAAGDYKASIEAAFNRVDEAVKPMLGSMDKSRVEWSEPIMWRACYNSFVAVVAGNKVYMAGGGGFVALRVGGGRRAVPISPLLDILDLSQIKLAVAGGDEADWPYLESLRTDPELFLFTEYEVDMSKDDCIVVEQLSMFTRSGKPFWLDHGKDWGLALTSIVKSGLRDPYGAVLLALEEPQPEPEPEWGSSSPVPAPVFISKPLPQRETPLALPIPCA